MEESEHIEENVVIHNGPLQLAGRLHYHALLTNTRGKILILPPHPFLGGNMDNNVVRGLAHHLAERAMVVRFDVRGLGESTPDPALNMQTEQATFFRDSTCPRYEAAFGEDCQAACDFVHSLGQPGIPLWVVGYSFGALWALHLLATRNEVAAAALIAPPLLRWSFPVELLSTPRPKAFFMAEDDFASSSLERARLFHLTAEPKTWIVLDSGNDHFFIGQEERLASLVGNFFHNTLDNPP